MKNLNVAIPTPFHNDESLYLAGFEPIVEHLKSNEIKSILISGTTGEQHSMSIEERIQIIHYFNRKKFQEVELIFGVSDTRTAEAVRLIKALENSVFDAIMVGFPPYIKPTQEQAISYVDELLRHTSKETALYNNPGRTGFDLSTETFNELFSRHSNLIGLKEGGDVQRYQNKNLSEDFIMFAAGDVDLPENINEGCNGLSSMVGNVYPKEITYMFNKLLTKRKIEFHILNDMVDEVTHQQTIANIKRHYNQLGFEVGNCRAPLNI